MNRRAVQLDGIRGLAMMAICWDHWCPAGWPRLFPFEIFLFFFLVLTGYLITQSLLQQRDRGDSSEQPWRGRALLRYQLRRSLRILTPYYPALLLCLLLGCEDVRNGFWWYACHFANVRMATLGEWPAGSNHFWSLSMQQQFYWVWPLVMWWTPARWLPVPIIALIVAGPLTRYHHDWFTHWLPWPQLLTPASLDYFGLGALLAWLVRRGMPLHSPLLRGFSILAAAGYLLLFCAEPIGFSPHGWKFLQQTSLAIALCGFIACASSGLRGWPGSLLEWQPLQRVGKYSYGLYLFHNPAPLLAGKLFWFLWNPAIPQPLAAWLQLTAFALTAAALTLASWHWIEQPIQSLRPRPSPN